MHFDDLSGEAFFCLTIRCGNNLNLILNHWKVIGSYLKLLTICSKVDNNE